MKKYITICITVVLCLFCVAFTAYAEDVTDGEQQDYCSICDVNGDGAVTAVDARLALRASAKLETLADDAANRADSNEDNAIRADDARTILRIAAKLDARPEHSVDPVPGKAATCTETGLTDGTKCSKCGNIVVEQEVIPATGHKEVIDPAVAATCTEKGLTAGSHCGNCNEVIVAQNDVPATDHDSVDVDEKAATCTRAGYTAGKKCNNCEETIEGCEEIPATNHEGTIMEFAGRDATCTENGLTSSKYCVSCGKIFEVQTVIAKLGHEFGTEYVTDKAATCTEKGSMSYHCVRCDEIKDSKEIPVKAHTEVVIDAVAATCTQNGSTERIECADCGAVLTSAATIVATGHTSEDLPAKAATCTETGLTAGKKCSVCNEVLVAQDEIPATGHTEEILPGYAATCTEKGLTEGKKCTVCNEVLVAQGEIPATGHTEEILPGYAATCTATGLTEGKKCTVCNEVLVAQGEISATGHTEVVVLGYAATCTETGLTDGKECTVCGVTIVEREVIPATGHDYSAEWTTDVEPTYTNKGVESRHCANCDATTDEREISTKLEAMIADANEWASDSGLDSLISGKAEDNTLTMEINVDGIWNANDVNADAFDGLLTNLGSYIRDNLGTTEITIDGEKVYSNGVLHNTAVKNTIFNVGAGFFYNIANLDADGVYGEYAIVADGEDIAFKVVFTGSDSNLAKIKEFAGVVAEHISMEVVNGNMEISVEAPEKFIESMENELGFTPVADITVADLAGYLADWETEEIFGSQVTAIDKLASTLCGFEGLINKVAEKVTSATVEVNGRQIDLLNGNSFKAEGDVKDFGVFAAAVKAMLGDELLETSLGEFATADGWYQIPVTVTVDMSNLGTMENSSITETVIFNIHMPVETASVADKLAEMVADANNWAAESGLDSLISGKSEDNTLTMEINVDGIWNANDVNADAFDGLLTNLGSYIRDNLGTTEITIDGEKVYSNGVLHNTAVKNTIFNVGAGFFYNIANLDADGVYGEYAIVADGEDIAFKVVFTGSDSNLEKIKEFAGVVAEHISMEVVNGNMEISVEAPEKFIESMENELGFTPVADITVADFAGYLADWETEEIFGSQVTAIDKLASTLCGFEGLINKVAEKVTSATVEVNGRQIDLLNGNSFKAEGDVKDFGVFAAAVKAMLGDELLETSLGEFATADGWYQIPVTVTVDMSNLGTMENSSITETVIFNIHMPVETASVADKLAEMVADANNWASESGLDSLISGKSEDNTLTMEINVDGIWNANDVNADAFDGLLTNLGSYIRDNLGTTEITIDGEKVYSNGVLHNTAVKNTIFNVGAGFFYNIANLDADGVYGEYAIVADGEDIAFKVVFTGSDSNLAKIKEFAGVVAEHISMEVVNGNMVVDMILPEKYMTTLFEGMTNEEIVEHVKNVMFSEFVDTLENLHTDMIFGSQATAIDKLASTLCGFEGLINKVIDKVTSATIEVNGEQIDILNGNSFKAEDGVNNFGNLMGAIGDMLTDELLNKSLGEVMEGDVIVMPITVTVDMSNLGTMENSSITETVIINLHLF